MWIRRAPWQMSRGSPYTKSIKKQHSEAECWCHRTVNIHTYCTTKIQNVKQFLSLGSPTSRLQKFLSCFQVGACFKRHKYLKIILNVESRTLPVCTSIMVVPTTQSVKMTLTWMSHFKQFMKQLRARPTCPGPRCIRKLLNRFSQALHKSRWVWRDMTSFRFFGADACTVI